MKGRAGGNGGKVVLGEGVEYGIKRGRRRAVIPITSKDREGIEKEEI